jgi:hypothetical protein
MIDKMNQDLGIILKQGCFHFIEEYMPQFLLLGAGLLVMHKPQLQDSGYPFAVQGEILPGLSI